jgi:hypothetical protein
VTNYSTVFTVNALYINFETPEEASTYRGERSLPGHQLYLLFDTAGRFVVTERLRNVEFKLGKMSSFEEHVGFTN